MPFISDLDTPLLRISPNDFFTLRDACGGVHIFGGIGSGKTSGSGAALAGALLRSGAGGIVCCAKAEEVALWQHYAAIHGRANSLVVFDGKTHAFNFLAYELARQGSDGLNSVIACLMRVLEAARLASATPGNAPDQFWQDTSLQLLRNTIPVLYAATGTVRIPDIVAFVRSAPHSPAQMAEPAWQAGSFLYQAFSAAWQQHPVTAPNAGLRANAHYWRDEFAALDAKTRGNIAISLSTTLDRFTHGRLNDAFCDRTTLIPELTFHGIVILLAMPALTWNEDGIIAQQLWKYMWQRAVLARNALPEQHRTRPVFCYADEAQYFVNSYDAEFQSTCRGSRACTVYLTQSLPTYYAKLGENARDRTHHLLSNFGTKIWHSNACAETNEWAARTIGRILHRRGTFSSGESVTRNTGMNRGESVHHGSTFSSGTSYGPQGSTTNTSFGSSSGSGANWGDNRGLGHAGSVTQGFNEQMDYRIDPGEFSSKLRTGGPAEGYEVDAVWFQAGKRFRHTDCNTLIPTFRQ